VIDETSEREPTSKDPDQGVFAFRARGVRGSASIVPPPTTPPEADDAIFSPGFRREMKAQVWTRVEIGATIVLDALLLGLSLLVRACLLWFVHKVAPMSSPLAPEEDLRDWTANIVEFILNFGLVGTVVIVTVFDLWKRIRQGYRGLSSQ
jgi:hypothetical protein